VSAKVKAIILKDKSSRPKIDQLTTSLAGPAAVTFLKTEP